MLCNVCHLKIFQVEIFVANGMDLLKNKKYLSRCLGGAGELQGGFGVSVRKRLHYQVEFGSVLVGSRQAMSWVWKCLGQAG